MRVMVADPLSSTGARRRRRQSDYTPAADGHGELLTSRAARAAQTGYRQCVPAVLERAAARWPATTRTANDHEDHPPATAVDAGWPLQRDARRSTRRVVRPQPRA